ncbi:hypothetical protein FQR65_LT18800 [Abscondita terminalis]|nr:hypothetical protein FQR65_LT18800 [Abscondita terminalis]
MTRGEMEAYRPPNGGMSVGAQEDRQGLGDESCPEGLSRGAFCPAAKSATAYRKDMLRASSANSVQRSFVSLHDYASVASVLHFDGYQVHRLKLQLATKGASWTIAASHGVGSRRISKQMHSRGSARWARSMRALRMHGPSELEFSRSWRPSTETVALVAECSSGPRATESSSAMLQLSQPSPGTLRGEEFQLGPDQRTARSRKEGGNLAPVLEKAPRKEISAPKFSPMAWNAANIETRSRPPEGHAAARRQCSKLPLLCHYSVGVKWASSCNGPRQSLGRLPKSYKSQAEKMKEVSEVAKAPRATQDAPGQPARQLQGSGRSLQGRIKGPFVVRIVAALIGVAEMAAQAAGQIASDGGMQDPGLGGGMSFQAGAPGLGGAIGSFNAGMAEVGKAYRRISMMQTAPCSAAA